MLEKTESETRVIKNPLLSASVTGLSAEDFPNKPLLLPAAPPIEKSVYLEEPTDSQKSVTVGQTPEIDTETLSEINLSSAVDDDVYLNDPNDSFIQVSEIQDISLLSQAASSFTQLPTVASTVLSTFSKVIKEYSPTSNLEKNLDQSDENKTLITPPGFCTVSNTNQLDLVPPTFYSPVNVNLSPPTANFPISSNNVNSYRLNAKRKTYAQIPGLIQTTQYSKPFDFNTNVTSGQCSLSDPQNFQSVSIPKENTDDSIKQKTEEEKERLFPFTSLVPSVLQNISDLVIETVSKNSPAKLSPTVSAGTQKKFTEENISTCSITNNNIFVGPRKIDDDCTSKSLPSKVNYQEYNTEVLTELQSTSSKSTLNSKDISSKLSLGNPSGNTFRLQKGTRHYKTPLILQHTKEAAPVFIPQFPDISAEPDQLYPTPQEILSESSICAKSNIIVPPVVTNAVSLYNPVNSSPFSEQNNVRCKEYNQSNNITNYTSRSKVDKRQDTSIDTEYSETIFKEKYIHDKLVTPTVKAQQTNLIVSEKCTLSAQQKNQEPDNNKFNSSSSDISSEEISKLLQREPEIQTTNLLPIKNETAIGLKHSPRQSLNLENYFSIHNNTPQQQIRTKSNNNLNEVLESTEINENFLKLSKSSEGIAKEDASSITHSVNKKEEGSANVAKNLSAHESDPLSFFDSFNDHTKNQIQHLHKDCNTLRIQDFFNNHLPNIEDSKSTQLEYSVDSTTSEGALLSASNIANLSEFPEMAALLNSNPDGLGPYKPVSPHWFYKKNIDTKHIWAPFSYIDSKALEDNYQAGDNKMCVVAVEGGRFDVNIIENKRMPVYWAGEPTDVRRCSWFYKAVNSKYIPYEESTAYLLEEEYKKASETGEWHRKIPLASGITVVFHGPAVMVHYLQSQIGVDISSQASSRPYIVKRGMDDFNIESGESATANHLLFMVHGVGSACDLKFRPVEEVVDDFRSIALQLVQSHYKNSYEEGIVNRIEVLPVSWHSHLHSEESGIDKKLKAITLESIPKLRNFTNDTLLDILFYTSPVFCQHIISTVCEAINKIYMKYCQRNPTFKGEVSLAGHSLGSLILFDLLCHQKCTKEMEITNSENPDQIVEPIKFNSKLPSAQQVSYTLDNSGTGTGQPSINYPQLNFHPQKFFALGSPIGMFVTIRGIETLGLDFKFPTCSNFFHIFHPYDPVAYRIEPLVNPALSNTRPVLIAHHKGRKRMHLELKETMTRVGADLKQKIINALRNTLDSVNFLSYQNKTEANEDIAKEVDKVLEMQLQLDDEIPRSRANSNSTQSEIDIGEVDLPLGVLNDNRRIDYVLQEAPLEFFNEYIFALTSHVCYWESEDTVLFIMKEIYSSLNISPDSQIPQQSMTIERPNSKASSSLVPLNI